MKSKPLPFTGPGAMPKSYTQSPLPVYDRTLEAWTTETKCPVCNTCRIDHRTGRCVAGGPFSGYVDLTHSPLVLHSGEPTLPSGNDSKLVKP